MLVRKLTGDKVLALIGGLVLLTSFLWVVNSHYVTTDVPVSALGIYTIYVWLCCVDRLNSLSIRDMAIVGLLIGLTTTAKYTGALVIVPIFLSIATGCNNKKAALGYIVTIGVISLLTFFLITPFALVNIEEFLGDLYRLKGFSETGWFGYNSDNPWFYYFTSLINSLGIPILALSLIGILYFVFGGKFKVQQKIIIIIYPVICFIFFSCSEMVFNRYVLPILPFIAIFTAIFFQSVLILVEKKIGHPTLLSNYIPLVITFFCIWPNLINAISHNLLMQKSDTRADVTNLINDKELRLEEYGAVFVGIYVKKNLKNTPTFSEFEKVLEKKTGVIIMDSFSHDRFISAYEVEASSIGIGSSIFSRSNNVLIISPFNSLKKDVTYSPESTYSPYFPDIEYRIKPGPYIEIYISSTDLLNKLIEKCVAIGIVCETPSFDKGYYQGQYKYFTSSDRTPK